MATATTDILLMMRAREGDRDGFDELVQRHRTDLIGYLYRVVFNYAIAEELAQEAFLRAYRSRARYEPTAKFTTWLYRIGTRLAWNWLRDNRRTLHHESIEQEREDHRPLQIPDPQPLADSRMVQADRARRVQRALARLPERQRSAVVMLRYNGLSYGEIAEALGTSTQSVKALLFRAHATLRERLLEEFGT
jgi:RNA polymerase sigma-70 factor, ECF subfamily